MTTLQAGELGQTDRHTHTNGWTDATKYIISLAPSFETLVQKK